MLRLLQSCLSMDPTLRANDASATLHSSSLSRWDSQLPRELLKLIIAQLRLAERLHLAGVNRRFRHELFDHPNAQAQHWQYLPSVSFAHRHFSVDGKEYVSCVVDGTIEFSRVERPVAFSSSLWTSLCSMSPSVSHSHVLEYLLKSSLRCVPRLTFHYCNCCDESTGPRLPQLTTLRSVRHLTVVAPFTIAYPSLCTAIISDIVTVFQNVTNTSHPPLALQTFRLDGSLYLSPLSQQLSIQLMAALDTLSDSRYFPHLEFIEIEPLSVAHALSKTIKARVNNSIANSQPLSLLPSLQYLSLYVTQSTPTILPYLQSLTAIKFSDYVYSNVFENLAQLPLLQHLEFVDHEVREEMKQEEMIEWLSRCPSLTSLTLHCLLCPVSISKLRQVSELQLVIEPVVENAFAPAVGNDNSNDWSDDSDRKTPEWCESLLSMASLEYLQLSEQRPQKKELYGLTYCRKGRPQREFLAALLRHSQRDIRSSQPVLPQLKYLILDSDSSLQSCVPTSECLHQFLDCWLASGQSESKSMLPTLQLLALIGHQLPDVSGQRHLPVRTVCQRTLLTESSIAAAREIRSTRSINRWLRDHLEFE